MALTKKQQQTRRSGIGGSEVAVIAGLSSWKSPIEIWEAKVRGLDIESSYAMELGNEFEAPIARVWARMNNRTITLVDTLRHPEKEFAIATPDRAVYVSKEAAGDLRAKKTDVRDAEKLLEVKSTNWRMRHMWGDEGTDQVPTEYLVQAMWQMGVSGVHTCDFAVDFDKTKLCQYRVQFDAEMFGDLYTLAEKFMIDHVLKGAPPPADSSDGFTEYLKRTFPKETTADFEVVTDETFAALCARFASAKAFDKRLEEHLKFLRNAIVLRIGGAPGVTGPFGKISYKGTKNKQVTDWKKVSDEAMRIAGVVVNTLPDGDTKAALSEDLRKLIADATEVRPGHRVLLPKWEPGFGAGEFVLPNEEPESLAPEAESMQNE